MKNDAFGFLFFVYGDMEWKDTMKAVGVNCKSRGRNLSFIITSILKK